MCFRWNSPWNSFECLPVFFRFFHVVFFGIFRFHFFFFGELLQPSYGNFISLVDNQKKKKKKKGNSQTPKMAYGRSRFVVARCTLHTITYTVYRYVVRHRALAHTTFYTVPFNSYRKKKTKNKIRQLLKLCTKEPTTNDTRTQWYANEKEKKTQLTRNFNRKRNECGIDCVMWRHCCRCNQKYSFFTWFSFSFRCLSL